MLCRAFFDPNLSPVDLLKLFPVHARKVCAVQCSAHSVGVRIDSLGSGLRSEVPSLQSLHAMRWGVRDWWHLQQLHKFRIFMTDSVRNRRGTCETAMPTIWSCRSPILGAAGNWISPVSYMKYTRTGTRTSPHWQIDRWTVGMPRSCGSHLPFSHSIYQLWSIGRCHGATCDVDGGREGFFSSIGGWVMAVRRPRTSFP